LTAAVVNNPVGHLPNEEIEMTEQRRSNGSLP
jgi:hypothetical protein